MSDRIETDLLVELITKKHDVLVQLRELSRRQSDLIAEGQMSKLLNLLATKQTLLNQVQQFDRQLAPFREQEPEDRVWRRPEDRLHCRQVAQRCESLIGEIMIVEKQSEAELTVRRDQVAAKLQGMHTASEARKAYSDPNRPNFGSLDLTSQK